MLWKNETLRRSLMIATGVMTAIYLGYRGLYTLNLDGWYASAMSAGLLAAEVYGSVLMFLYFFSVWKISEPEHVDPPAGLTVDVYIPTYNEDAELLRGTIAAALALDYPHETYVLDDGKRPEVRELCERMGAHYLDRPDNQHAKAGNLNHAMTKTTGEFIVIFDADHIAQRHFITRLLGHFHLDKRLAFIQTPHAFYNFDNFQGTLDYSKGIYWEEGQLFYNVIQPGKNHWNAVSFCGSAAMFRREALDDVGGVATETITEDMQTGIRLHGRGWKSLFVNERLVSGQAATDVTAFNTQRLRWGEGNLSIFAHDNPFTMPGLTLAQRLCYLGAMLSWTTGVQKLMLYASPIAMLLTGISPVREFTPLLGIITAVYLMTVWTTVKVVSNGYGHLLGTELTHMACFWTQIRATYRASFKRKFAKFIVTSKRGAQSNRLISHIMPQVVLMIASGVAIAVAGSRLWFGASTDVVALFVGGGLITFHAWFAWVVLCRAMRSKDLRYSWRHPAAVHVRYTYTDGGGIEQTGQGVTYDMNERGAGLFLYANPDVDRLRVTFTAGGRNAEVDVNVRMSRPALDEPSPYGEKRQAWRVGVEFENLTEHTHATLWWMAATYSVARLYDRFQHTSGHAPEDSAHRDLATRFKPQAERNLPITLSEVSGTRQWSAITERLGSKRAAIVLHEPLPEGEWLLYELTTPAGRLTGRLQVGEGEQVCVGSEPYVVQELLFGQQNQRWRRNLGEIVKAPAGSTLREVTEFSPDESKLPTMKAGSTVGAGSLAAAILAIMINGWWMADEILVSRVLTQGSATPQQRAALDTIADRIADHPTPDERFVLRLREAFRQIDYATGIRKVDDLICDTEFKTFYGMLTRAQVLDQRGEHERAGEIVDMLVANQDRVVGPQQRDHLWVTVAQSYANRKKYEPARVLLQNLVSADPTNPHLRRTYATVLIALGDLSDARQLYASTADSPEEAIEFASLLSAGGQYVEAADLLLGVNAQHGADPTLVREAATNAMAGMRFGVAAELYRWLLEKSPGGDARELRLRLAQAYQWSNQADKAVATLQQIVDAGSSDQATLIAYLQAVASSDQPPAKSGATVERLFSKQAGSRGNDEFVQALADAMMRLGRVEEVTPLLARIAERNPNSPEAQLFLADALRQLGRHEDAAEHYRRALAATNSVNERLSSNAF